jgi:hypothetical protein
MLLEVFNTEYGLETLLGKNKINRIIESKIINNEVLIELLKEYNILKRIGYCHAFLNLNL